MNNKSEMTLALQASITRRHFFGLGSPGIGVAALAAMLGRDLYAQSEGKQSPGSENAGLPGLPHFPPRAKRVIWLFQSGGPSQMDLFDYKPELARLRKTDLPDSIRK